MRALEHRGVRPELFALTRLTIHLAHVVPSEAAAPLASLEWRVIRKAWLASIEQLGMTEAIVRDLAARTMAEGFAEAMQAFTVEGPLQ